MGPWSPCCRHSTSDVLLQGSGLHALNRTGLLLPVVPAPIHQPARALVCQLLLPVPGSGYGKCVTSPGSGEPHCHQITIQSKGVVGLASALTCPVLGNLSIPLLALLRALASEPLALRFR